MTEVGMALSNPYRGSRHPGAVGSPLPGVTVKVQEDGGSLDGCSGSMHQIINEHSFGILNKLL